jgi:hypothetical protein
MISMPSDLASTNIQGERGPCSGWAARRRLTEGRPLCASDGAPDPHAYRCHPLRSIRPRKCFQLMTSNSSPPRPAQNDTPVSVSPVMPGALVKSLWRCIYLFPLISLLIARKLSGESAMKFWEVLAEFRRWPGFCSQVHYEKLPLCSCHENRTVARYERHSDCYSISESRPSMRDTKVVVSLDLRRRRREQIRTSPLAEHALDQCEEAFRRGDWRKFGYWHAVFLRERNRLNHPTRFS